MGDFDGVRMSAPCLLCGACEVGVTDGDRLRVCESCLGRVTHSYCCVLCGRHEAPRSGLLVSVASLCRICEELVTAGRVPHAFHCTSLLPPEIGRPALAYCGRAAVLVGVHIGNVGRRDGYSTHLRYRLSFYCDRHAADEEERHMLLWSRPLAPPPS